MPEFSFEALDDKQSPVQGTITASSRKAALQKIRLRNLQPLGIQETSNKSAPSQGMGSTTTNAKIQDFFKFSIFAKKATSQGNPALGLEFLKQLLELHESGMPVGDAIKILSQRTTSTELKLLCSELWNQLSSGVSLATAMKSFPKSFNKSTIRVIEAGEATGNIAPILQKIIDSLEETRQIQKKIISSLSYPAFISLLAIAVVLFFLLYLLPQIRTMLDSLGGEMSFSAKILIQGSELLIVLSPFAAIILTLVGSLLIGWIKTRNGRRAWDAFLYKIPLLGSIIEYSNLYSITQLLTTLMANNIHATESIQMAEKAITNTYLRERVSGARQQIIEGISISKAFKNYNIYPSISLDILRIGEETGNTLHSLEKISLSFRNKLTEKLQFATKLFSSLALFFAFTLVALIALGIVSSILQVSHSIQMQ